VHITELASPCLTRQRGKEAYRNLVPYLHAGQVDVILDGVEMLSLSYLDGIVNSLIATGSTGDVTFVVSDQRFMNKLARVAEIRQTKLFARHPKDISRCEVQSR
jgi:hypothetical protein